MRILYGVCGEGFGHSSRASAIISHLIKDKHEVLILTYDQAYSSLKEFRPVKIFGIGLEYKKGKLSLWKSLIKNQKSLFKKSKDFPKIKKLVKDFSPEICISDMEPIVPIISYWKNLPLISIDNQHSLIYSNLKIPSKYKKDFLIAKSFINGCISRADYFIILSFLKEKAKKKNVFFVNPLIKKEILKITPEEKNFILVYLSKPDNSLMSVLKKTKEKFVIYGQKNSGKSGNLTYKKKGKGFATDLKNCKAIVATSGFSLMSEALYLKKPYFAIPMKGQFEQYTNSFYLKKSGFGSFSENPTPSELNDFFSRNKTFKRNLKKYKANPKEALNLLNKLLKKIEKDLSKK